MFKRKKRYTYPDVNEAFSGCTFVERSEAGLSYYKDPDGEVIVSTVMEANTLSSIVSFLEREKCLSTETQADGGIRLIFNSPVDNCNMHPDRLYKLIMSFRPEIIENDPCLSPKENHEDRFAIIVNRLSVARQLAV